MPPASLCHLILRALQKKLKRPYPSKRVTLSQTLVLRTRIYYILGMFRGATIATASFRSVLIASYSYPLVAGALVMYQQAQKLAASVVDVASFVETAQPQLEAIMIAVNALSLVDSKNAWIVVPKSNTTVRKNAIIFPRGPLTLLLQARNKRIILNHVPENRFSSRKYDAEIVHLSDMQYDCTLLRAQIDLIRKDPSLLSSQGKFFFELDAFMVRLSNVVNPIPEFLMPPALIVLRLANMNFYEQALTTARALDIDMTDVFTQLATHCLRLTRNPDGVL